MSIRANTHQLDIRIVPSDVVLIQRIRSYIHGACRPQGYTSLVWTAVSFSSSSIRFLTESPYSNDITGSHARCVLEECLSWLLPHTPHCKLSFSVAALITEGAFINGAGTVMQRCGKRSCQFLNQQETLPYPTLETLERQAELEAINFSGNTTPQLDNCTPEFGSANSQYMSTVPTAAFQPPREIV